MPCSEKSGTPVNRRIGQRILLARRRLDLTQKELADAAGISQTVVTRLENGLQSVSAERLATIAKALNLSLDFLCQEAGPLEPEGDEEGEREPADAA